MMFLGIDPGQSGGIAVLAEDGAVRHAWPMPKTERDLWDRLGAICPAIAVTATIEGVHASPQMGVSSAFTFGKGYGSLLMALTGRGIPFSPITPRRWQGFLSCTTGGDKNVTKRRAQQLFPGTTITHAIADALLIAEYTRQIWHARQRRLPHGKSNEGTMAEQGQGHDDGAGPPAAGGRARGRAAGPGAGPRRQARRAV